MFVWQNLRGIHGQKCMYIEQNAVYMDYPG